MLASLLMTAAQANPLGEVVKSGEASFNRAGSTLTITNNPGAIIHWQGFSIDAGETTRFVQQSASSAVLNRVVGGDPSTILGSLQSNGKVFLINPSGILFGQGSRIDVAALVATTLSLSDEDFLAGRLNFTAGALQGSSVKNQGTITTPSGGSVILVAPQVENSGVIHAPDGSIILAAGSSVRLGDTGTPNVLVEIQAPDNQAINVGQLVVDGGSVGIYAGLIDQRGIVSANAATVNEAGKIVFKATQSITLAAGSSTTANGRVVNDASSIRIEAPTIDLSGAVASTGTVEVVGSVIPSAPSGGPAITPDPGGVSVDPNAGNGGTVITSGSGGTSTGAGGLTTGGGASLPPGGTSGGVTTGGGGVGVSGAGSGQSQGGVTVGNGGATGNSGNGNGGSSNGNAGVPPTVTPPSNDASRIGAALAAANSIAGPMLQNSVITALPTSGPQIPGPISGAGISSGPAANPVLIESSAFASDQSRLSVKQGEGGRIQFQSQ